MRVDVLIPTLGRPHRVADLVANISETAPDANVVFVAEGHDEATLRACWAAGAVVVVNTRAASYAGAINCAARLTAGDAIFCGADDLLFHPGWFDAVKLLERHAVVGTDDLHNHEVIAGTHSTHHFVRRDWFAHAVVDEPGLVLCERYTHNWCDTELVKSAQARGQWVMCRESVVEHLHPAWGFGGIDATYEKGYGSEQGDARTFEARRHLWLSMS